MLRKPAVVPRLHRDPSSQLESDSVGQSLFAASVRKTRSRDSPLLNLGLLLRLRVLEDLSDRSCKLAMAAPIPFSRTSFGFRCSPQGAKFVRPLQENLSKGSDNKPGNEAAIWPSGVVNRHGRADHASRRQRFLRSMLLSIRHSRDHLPSRATRAKSYLAPTGGAIQRPGARRPKIKRLSAGVPLGPAPGRFLRILDARAQSASG